MIFCVSVGVSAPNPTSHRPILNLSTDLESPGQGYLGTDLTKKISTNTFFIGYVCLSVRSIGVCVCPSVFFSNLTSYLPVCIRSYYYCRGKFLLWNISQNSHFIIAREIHFWNKQTKNGKIIYTYIYIIWVC